MKHILLPTDFSDNSWKAISYAKQLFENESCTFHILNTYEQIVYREEYVTGTSPQQIVMNELKENSLNGLKDIESKILNTFGENKKHELKTYSKIDSLIPCIKYFVLKNDINLVVMGTKGATGAKEVLFGSNTVHVFKEVKCAVIAVPSDYNYIKPKNILFPNDLEVDFNSLQMSSLKSIIENHNAVLNTIFVSKKQELNEEETWSKSLLESLFKTENFKFSQVQNTSVNKAIIEFQDNTKIEMLTMVNNKHSFLENLFFKSTIDKIGSHLTVPFLVIPANR